MRKRAGRVAWMTVSLVLACGVCAGQDDIKDDEEVIFLPTYARFDRARTQVEVPVHGWIFERETGSLSRRALLAALKHKLELTDDEAQSRIFEGRARMFLVDNERGKEIAIRFGAKRFTLDKSKPDGHFRTTLRIETAQVGPADDEFLVRDGWLRFRAVTRDDDRRVFTGAVQLIEPEGVSVISDIDDTIKITDVRDRKAMVRNTFLRPFEAVPGMAALYREAARRGARFHYVSAGPWQLYPSLSHFTMADGFPDGSFHMRELRWKDASLVEFLSPSEEYKVSTIDAIVADFPKRRFLLIGDSGEKDPEVYGRIARKHPEQVTGIFIRNVTDEKLTDARFAEAFKDVPRETWMLFATPDAVREPMSGLLK